MSVRKSRIIKIQMFDGSYTDVRVDSIEAIKPTPNDSYGESLILLKDGGFLDSLDTAEDIAAAANAKNLPQKTVDFLKRGIIKERQLRLQELIEKDEQLEREEFSEYIEDFGPCHSEEETKNYNWKRGRLIFDFTRFGSETRDSIKILEERVKSQEKKVKNIEAEIVATRRKIRDSFIVSLAGKFCLAAHENSAKPSWMMKFYNFRFAHFGKKKKELFQTLDSLKGQLSAEKQKEYIEKHDKKIEISKGKFIKEMSDFSMDILNISQEEAQIRHEEKINAWQLEISNPSPNLTAAEEDELELRKDMITAIDSDPRYDFHQGRDGVYRNFADPANSDYANNALQGFEFKFAA